MRNPLNAIISHCTLLEKENLKIIKKKRMKTIKVACNLMSSFLQDMVDWT